jgi:hypothetical protein
LLQRLRAIPGVRGASLSLSGLFNGVSLDADISVEGQAVASGQRMSAICDYVGPSYFSTVGIPILAGREIGPQDEDNAPLVGVINQTLAGAYFGGTNPIGRRIRASASYGTLDFVVVGVVADSKRDDLRESTESCFYVPYFHAAPHPNFAWAVNEARIAGKAAAAVLAIRAAIKETAPSMDMPEIRVINELVNQSITIERILTRFRIPELIWVEVIGVVAHQRQTALAEPGREQVYFTDGFRGNGLDVYWAVRAKGDPAQYASVIRAEVAKFRPNLLVTEMRPMEALVKRARQGRASRSCCRRLRGHRGATGGRRTVRRVVKRGATAYGGDRRSDGSRRDARKRLQTCSRTRTASQRDRPRSRYGRCFRTHARDDQHARRRQSDRPGYIHGHGCALFDHRRHRIGIARAASGEGRSARGATPRIVWPITPIMTFVIEID